ncbi:hypothetical protein [Halorussus amylolyticus]|uniref:hypothetical protein n=1 Tax=Halorussus amylolyticus TaxID=1126242 RepID=UPI00104E8C65|nr:hypothetical protein [Halorussus amylolyticus]
MTQRSDQHSGDSVADEYADLLDDDIATSDADTESSSSRSAESSSFAGRLQNRATSIFSPKVFLYAVLLLGAGMFAGNAFVPLPFLDSLAGLVGVFVSAFVLGLAVKRSTLLESAAAGAVAAGLMTVLGHLALSAFGGAGVPLAVVGAGSGLVAGALGAHFGGDLRDGLTQDI